MPEPKRDQQSEFLTRRRHRLAVIGDLTADVSHHLNNLATSVFGSAGLIERAAERDEPTGEHIDALRRAARAIGQATRALQRFAINEPHRRSPVRFDTLVTEIAQMVRLPAAVRLSVTPSPLPSATVLGSEPDLRHLVAAMLLVAREATESRGAIELTLRQQHPNCTFSVVADPDASGGAMSEPFWGSSHCLRVLDSIAAEHGAELTRETAPGSLSVTIPLLQDNPEPRHAPTPGPDEGRGSLVLLQIRNDQTRSLLSTALSGTGFSVVACPTREAAFQTIRRAAGDGRTPGAIVIEGPLPPSEPLTSAGVPVVMIAETPADGAIPAPGSLAAVLTKPYKMADFVRTIAGVIHSHQVPNPPEAKG